MLDRRSLLFSPIVCLGLASGSVVVPAPDGIIAVTRPSADPMLSFVQPGRITKIHVKEGDPVKLGQVIIQQDDAVDRARLAQGEAQSQDTTQIRASEASLAQKQVDLKKLEVAAARNAATELEVEHARLDAKIAELSLELAKFEHEQARRKYDEEKARVDNMRLVSPIDGTIEKVHVEVGESVNALGEAVQVVQIDPLWVDVPVPLAQAMALKCGGAAMVEFPAPQRVFVEGKIIYVGAVADAASGTLRVRLEVPNKSRRPAGEHIKAGF